jgi:hypothetical protein
MNNMTKFLIILIFLSICGILTAQSIFSFYGPADIAYQRDAFGEGMGGTGAGDLFRVNTNLVNPALSVTVNRTYFSTAVSMGNISYRDSGGGSFTDNQFYLPYFSLVFPYKQNRFGFHYQNMASGNLDTQSTSSVDFDTNLPVAPGSTNITQSENVALSMYKAGIFWANRNRIMHFGLGLNYVFGHDIRHSGLAFEQPGLANSSFEIENSFQNPAISVGVAKIFGDLSTGFAVNIPFDFKGETTFKTNQPNPKDPISENSKFELPYQTTVGLTYRVNDMFFISADADYEGWGSTDSFQNSVDTYRLGVGASWSGRPLSRVFLAKFPVRAGLSYRNLPFRVNDNLVHETAYHFGVSLPLKQYDSYMHVATKFFSRGNANKTDYEENGFLLTFGVHGFDFLRTPPNRKMHRDIPRPFDERRADTGEREGRGRRQDRETTEEGTQQ